MNNDKNPVNLENKSAETDQSFETLFNAGINSYNKKEFDKSIQAFGLAVTKSPKNLAAINNLALSHFQKGNKGWSIAYFRKALALNPDESTAVEGRDFVASQLEVKEVPHQIETYESIRGHFLEPVSLFSYLLLTACTFWGLGWIWLKYVGKKLNSDESEAPPSPPLLGYFFAIGFVLFGTLLSMKYYDLQIVWGTVVEPQVSVYSSPKTESAAEANSNDNSGQTSSVSTSNQVELFSLYAGLEVRVKMSKNDWYQITYPGASTGWVKKSAIMITSEKNL